MMWFLLVILVAAAVVIGIVMIDRRRSAELRQHFGPAYDRAMLEHGERRSAEADLRRRLDRRRSTDVRDLEPGERERLTARWQVVQAGFVDDPQRSVAEAASLIEEVMAERGYLRGTSDGAGPDDRDLDARDLDARDLDARDLDARDLDDRDLAGHDLDGHEPDGRDVDRDRDGVPDRYELVAVDHPTLVERFRSAPRVAPVADDGEAAPAMSADDLRALFLQHHELFDALVDDHQAGRSPRRQVARS